MKWLMRYIHMELQRGCLSIILWLFLWVRVTLWTWRSHFLGDAASKPSSATLPSAPFSKLDLEASVKYPTCVGARFQTLVLMVVQQKLLTPEQLSHPQQIQFFKMRIGNITFKDLENVRCFQIKLYPKHKKPPVVVCKQWWNRLVTFIKDLELILIIVVSGLSVLHRKCRLYCFQF